MPAFIVDQGDVRPYDPERLPERETYGQDWIYVEARTTADAEDEAKLYDATDGGSIEQRLFVAAYRAGALLLPGDAWVTINDLAARAGVARSTVQSWRQRHPNFPRPLQDAPPRWAWSEVAAWLRIPRRPGRPAAID